MEEFKLCLPDRIVTYLNEQKVSSLSRAAVLADEYMLTHKTTFGMQSSSASVSSERKNSTLGQASSTSKKEERECFYCHKTGHIIANCLTLKHKEQLKSKQPTTPNSYPLQNMKCQKSKESFVMDLHA